MGNTVPLLSNFLLPQIHLWNNFFVSIRLIAALVVTTPTGSTTCHAWISVDEQWTAAFPPCHWWRRGTARVPELSPVGLWVLPEGDLTVPHHQQPPGYDLLTSSGSSCSFTCDIVALELLRRRLWPTLSKDLLKSMTRTSVWWPPYMFSARSLTNKLHKLLLTGQLGPEPVL